MSKLEELHKAAMEAREPEENYNFEDSPNQSEENEFTVWAPVAKDVEFEKHIAKLKWMKKFNSGR